MFRRYAESINILYSTNIFTFLSPFSFNLFASSISLHDRTIIRRLHVEYRFDIYTSPSDIWKQFSNTIADIPGLEELYIRLDTGSLHSTSSSTASDMFNQMGMIKRVQDFEVELMQPAQYDLGDVPFRVRWSYNE
jgi:hypothetical protein